MTHPSDLPARTLQAPKRAWWLLAGVSAGLVFAMFAQDLAVHWRNEELHVTAPKLHFITGAPLEKLKNGAAVPYDFQLQLWAGSRDSTPLARTLSRFVVSYDLWEEKYSVTQFRGSVAAPENRVVSHLTASAAESWCIDHMGVPARGLRDDQPFYMRLDVRSAESKQEAGLVADTGISLTHLIDVFSHPARGGQQKWSVEAGPLKLGELKHATPGS